MIYSAILSGIESIPVRVEAIPTPGQALSVELPKQREREARVRLRSAMAASGIPCPEVRLRVIDMRTETVIESFAPGLDLALALAASEPGAHRAALGELALDGRVREARGVVGFDALAHERGWPAIVARAQEAETEHAHGVSTLAEAVEAAQLPARAAYKAPVSENTAVDFGDMVLTPAIRRACELAAAGSLDMLLVAPPGAGKTMLARRLPGILPALEADEERTLRTICSAAGLSYRGRPFRAPHHTVSAAGLVGGGTPVRPGEVTLAHGGVLFLDELPELQRGTWSALSEVLERREVTVGRGKEHATMPAEPLVVGAMNPCACSSFARPCSCPPARQSAYLARVETVTVARAFKLCVRLPKGQPEGERVSSAAMAERVRVARAMLSGGRGFTTEAQREAEAWADAHGQSQGVSGLVLAHRVLRVAGTLAALDATDTVREHHVEEAVGYVFTGKIGGA